MRRYVFSEEWDVAGSPDRVRDVVVDLASYPRWWPQIRAVASLGPDDALVRCRSVLPYTLDLILTARSRELPAVEVAIDGDLRGMARWSLTPTRAGTRMSFTQDVVVRGALVPASYLARPLLRWNHARMMAGCRAGLARALVREG